MKPNYVSTEQDIETSTRQMIGAVNTATQTRGEYLPRLVATAQHELEIVAKPRSAGRVAKLTDEEMQRQIAGVTLVHERFYAVVLREWDAAIPKGTKDRAKVLNSRTNYARTAVSILRTYIRSGKSLATVSPHTVNLRDTLKIVGPKRSRAVSPTVLRKRAEKEAHAFMSTVLALGETDKAAAISELELLVGQLAQQLTELSAARATTDAKVATAEHRPLRVGRSMFVPVTETQVIRQRANPS